MQKLRDAERLLFRDARLLQAKRIRTGLTVRLLRDYGKLKAGQIFVTDHRGAKKLIGEGLAESAEPSK